MKADVPMIRRVAMPEMQHARRVADDGQWEWVWAVPLAYRVLADTRLSGEMPMSPRTLLTARSGAAAWSYQHEHGRGYFACLQSLLTYSLGWTRHDKGIRQWHGAGQPTEDPRFALLKAVWSADELLLRYAAWFTERLNDLPPALGPSSPLSPFVAGSVDLRPIQDDRWTEFVREERVRAAAEHLSLSPWGMHLDQGDPIGAPSLKSGAWRLLASDQEHRTATFVSDGVHGWYNGLVEAGNGLPKLSGGRNWHVDVFVKPYGYLGTFRRSAVTGLWFSGRHRSHIIGN
ncbi:hypothetical protein [Microbacterium sp. P04]|uniref:hypothetical protein n=1 Tax=Microbacterium sp. P04 TaxID=3366947 RepID=UPI00374668CC